VSRRSPEVPEVDPATLDLSQTIADIEKIRAVNRHRFEFELLTAVTQLDPSQHFIVGYKDTSEQDFWVRGHLPGFPLMPGVLMLEASAQLCGYYLGVTNVAPGTTLGLGGIESAKFRRMVRPGDRLVLVGHGLKVDRRLTRFRVIGSVGNEEAFRVVVLGMPLKGIGS